MADQDGSFFAGGEISAGHAAGAAIFSNQTNLDNALPSTFDDVDGFVTKQRAALSNNGNLALHYAERGYYVFPAAPDNKSPLVARWLAQSTTDVETVAGWWRKHPHALVALDLGKVGLVVIDADRHGGPDGVDALTTILGDDLHALGCPITVTAGNGLHLYFAQPSEGKPLGNGVGALPPGIDIRGAGGYVIAPGTERTDGTSWEPDGPPFLWDILNRGAFPSLPKAIADLIRSQKVRPEAAQNWKAGAGAAQPTSGTLGARERNYGLAALNGRARDLAMIGAGGRNNALNDAAFYLATMEALDWIHVVEIRDALFPACVKNGYIRDDGIPSFNKTFNGAIFAGRKQPHVPLAEKNSSGDWTGDDIGKMIDRRNRAREADRETITVDVMIDSETGEVMRDAPCVKDAPRQEADAGSEEAPRAEWTSRKPDGAKPPFELKTVTASSFAGQPVPKQRWLVENLIPVNNVTMMSGDGAAGKSLLALQLAAAVATGSFWIGLRPERGRVLYLSAEDEIEELHRRLAIITPQLETLDNLEIVPLAGEDAVLAAPIGRDGLLKETYIFFALQRLIEKHLPKLMILDTLADLFGGNEILKLHARQFISMLRGLALKFNVTVLLLSHPSQQGMNSGEGTSGNTAWNNSVRSRLYIERRFVRDGNRAVEEDSDIRILSTKKSNRTARGGQIILRWVDGRFVREQQSDLNARDANEQADNVFMALLEQFEGEGRAVSDKSGANYAPKQFSEHADSNGVSKAQLRKAMDRLLKGKRIKIEEEGPPSRRTRKIVVVVPSPFVEQEERDENVQADPVF